ncbi:MAG: serine/threonine-protein kinase [bacterium]
MDTCPSCGASVEPAARFCLDCGYALDEAPEASTDPWQGRMVAGRFRLLSKLGDGGMGEVYRAEQLPMGRHVALKILRHALSDDPRQVERFKREAQAASALTHPNTIIVHDFGQDTDGTLFLAMEYLAGQPLNAVMAREGLPGERAARIMQQVCGSLDEAHRQGMVHRDLKPENIFLVERAGNPDFVKVLDFGIAKVTESGGQKLATITQAGAIFGTPQYMAPEQIRGDHVDARADIYALGVLLYELISGHLPFAAGSVVEMLTKHLTAPPAPIARTGSDSDPGLARLEAVALRALSKDPEHRQQTAREFLEDLMAAFPQLSLSAPTGLIPATPVGTPDVAALPSSGGSTKVVVFAALFAALAAGAWFWSQGGFGGGAGGGGANPIVVMQADPDGNGGGGDEAAPGTDAAPATEAAAPATEAAAAPETEAAAAPETESPAEQAAAAEADKVAEAEAAAAEAEAAKAEADANKPLSDEEAARIAEAAEAEAKQAAAEAEKAAAEMKAKEEAEKAAAAEAKKQDAEAAKSAADADKVAAQQAAAEAEGEAGRGRGEGRRGEGPGRGRGGQDRGAEGRRRRRAGQGRRRPRGGPQEQGGRRRRRRRRQGRGRSREGRGRGPQGSAQEDRGREGRRRRRRGRGQGSPGGGQGQGPGRQVQEARPRLLEALHPHALPGRAHHGGRQVPRHDPLRGGISLKPGNHTITAVKGGKRVNKKVTVKPGKIERVRIEI